MLLHDHLSMLDDVHRLATGMHTLSLACEATILTSVLLTRGDGVSGTRNPLFFALCFGLVCVTFVTNIIGIRQILHQALRAVGVISMWLAREAAVKMTQIGKPLHTVLSAPLVRPHYHSPMIA
jgi:hypothetical protein